LSSSSNRSAGSVSAVSNRRIHSSNALSIDASIVHRAEVVVVASVVERVLDDSTRALSRRRVAESGHALVGAVANGSVSSYAMSSDANIVNRAGIVVGVARNRVSRDVNALSELADGTLANVVRGWADLRDSGAVSSSASVVHGARVSIGASSRARGDQNAKSSSRVALRSVAIRKVGVNADRNLVLA